MMRLDADHTATILPDGTVLVAGGWEGSSERYDPASGALSAAGKMIATRRIHAATLLADGTVLVAAGISFASAELWNSPGGT